MSAQTLTRLFVTTPTVCRFRGDRDAFGLARVPVELDDSDDGESDDFGPRAGRARREGTSVRRALDDSDSDDGELTREQKDKVDEDLNVITAHMRQALRDKKRRGWGYVNLAQYLFFWFFYMVVVYIQSDAFNAYKVVSSVRQAMIPLNDDGSPKTTMQQPTEILEWLVQTTMPVWVDETCGDGTCNEPFEFPAYGRFGCRADCGMNTNLTTMLLQVRADFRDDLYSARAHERGVLEPVQTRRGGEKGGFPGRVLVGGGQDLLEDQGESPRDGERTSGLAVVRQHQG